MVQKPYYELRLRQKTWEKRLNQQVYTQVVKFVINFLYQTTKLTIRTSYITLHSAGRNGTQRGELGRSQFCVPDHPSTCSVNLSRHPSVVNKLRPPIKCNTTTLVNAHQNTILLIE